MTDFDELQDEAKKLEGEHVSAREEAKKLPCTPENMKRVAKENYEKRLPQTCKFIESLIATLASERKFSRTR